MPAEVSFEADSQGLSVSGEIAPAQSGPNTLQVDFSYEGRALRVPVVVVSAHSEELGPIAGELVPTGLPGRYRAEMFLPSPGAWRLTFSARLDTFTQATAVATIEVREEPDQTTPGAFVGFCETFTAGSSVRGALNCAS